MKKHKLLILAGLLGCTLSIVVPAVAQVRQAADKKQQDAQALEDYLRKGANSSPMAQPPDATARQKDASGQNSPLSTTYLNRGRKSFLMNGNKITTVVYNYGGIGPGYPPLRGVADVVWHNLSYVFQFCPLVGASVPSAYNPAARLHIISDGLNDYPGLYEESPTKDTLWQWQPIAGYDDPNQLSMASNPAPDNDGDGKPDSWPRSWYNPTLGKYVWPGYLAQDVLGADLEVLWAMDDRDNSEFPYYPFIQDSSRRGIGVQVVGRGFQWSNALAENTIFFVYTITNVSDKNLDTLFYGIYGDPDVGGGCPTSCNENLDDRGYFIPPYDSTGAVSKIPVYSRSIVYFWDTDMTGARGLPLGFVSCKFLESPGNPNDGIDNNGNGIIDERQDDGIDNDHDWNPITDDVGIDGVANTNDPGEGDGVPTAGLKLPDGTLDPLHPGEPNFEYTDLDESDQIGLTSFNSWTWNQDKISNDESMWRRCYPRNFGAIQQNADIVFIFGSGYIQLKKGETKRISMALLLGWTLDDLLASAKTVQTIYNNTYRFFKPPITPHMTALPGDKKVTLYWDSRAEASIDPVTGKDFEGYVIYRSTDPSFNDIQKVTDGRAVPFLSEPLRDFNGNEVKFDVAVRSEPFTDLNNNGVWDAGEPYVDENRNGFYDAAYEDPWKGYHPVPYQDRGVHYYLGNNSGLVHMYVDSNNVINGQTYYYAVVAYDHGDSVGIPPTETTKKITVDPISSQLNFDVNTAQVIPGPRASGYIAPVIGINNVMHQTGAGTGTVHFGVLNDLTVKEGNEYGLAFADSFFNVNKNTPGKNYSVLGLTPVTESFVPYDTNFSTLGHSSLSDDSVFAVKDASGTTYTRDVDYVVNLTRGSIRRTGTSRIPNNQRAFITYRYYPVYQSRSLKGGDGNPVFDGVEVKVIDADSLGYDAPHSAWIQGNSNFDYVMRPTLVGSRRALYPADYTIEFSSHYIDTALIRQSGPVFKHAVKYSVKKVTPNEPPERILTLLSEIIPATRDTQWTPGEEIVLFKPGAKGVGTDTTTWGIIVQRPADITKTPIFPTDGDVLFLATSRPFSNKDAYHLQTHAGRVDTRLASSMLDNVYVVPNPYVGINDLEPANRLPSAARGERRIYFEHLPPQCTIRIFTLSGDHVVTITHDSGVQNGREFWNLLNRDGFSIAYGVYIAHIDAPGIGEKILKFAVIK
jgi:hypothetical protein